MSIIVSVEEFLASDDSPVDNIVGDAVVIELFGIEGEGLLVTGVREGATDDVTGVVGVLVINET